MVGAVGVISKNRGVTPRDAIGTKTIFLFQTLFSRDLFRGKYGEEKQSICLQTGWWLNSAQGSWGVGLGSKKYYLGQAEFDHEDLGKEKIHC